MNERNLDYLKEGLKYLGFGDKLNAELEKNIQQRFPEFVLKYNGEYGTRQVEANLHFKMGQNNDMYFFNRYDATVRNTANPEQEKTQMFYIIRNSGMTLKEAFNLLEGRAVNKDFLTIKGETYNAWHQLDFNQKEDNGNYKVKQFHQNYGFNLEESLKKLSVKEITAGDEGQKDRVLRSLQKGNVQAVTVTKDGQEAIVFLTAAPQFKSINMYDGQMRKLNTQTLTRNESQGEGVKASAKTEVQSAADDADPEGATKGKKRQSKRKGQSV